MKNLEKNLSKVNALLHINYEVEKIYLEAYESVVDEDLKVFFKNTAFLRNEFCKVLVLEIKKMGGIPTHFNKLSNTFNRFLMKFKALLAEQNESELLALVSMIKRLSIDAYNELLRETNLSLSMCKVLVSQRDRIQSTLHAIQAQERLVA